MATTQKIEDLKPTLRSAPLMARVIRTWDVVYNSTDHPIAFDMILLDKQEGLIHATVRKDLMKTFKDDIVEGKIHTLNNFEVCINNKKNRPVKNEMLIKFTPFTTVLQEEETAAKIPMDNYQIHPLDRLQERNNKKDYAIDVVGVLIGIQDKTWVNVGSQRVPIRRLHIEDQCNMKVSVTLWNEKANLIDTDITKDQSYSKVLLITSTTVNMYQGNYQLNSTNATRIHINLPIPEVEAFMKRTEPTTPIKQLEAKSQESIEQAMFNNRKYIQDILQMDPQAQEMFTCSATIMSIDTDKKWNYISCDICKRKIDETLYCINCDVVVKYPKTRYLLSVDIDDGTATIPIALFDKEAEKIIGSPTYKLVELDKTYNGKQKVLERLQLCVGKQFAFKVKLSTRSERTELICQKAFEINYKLEKAYKEKNQDSEDKGGTKRLLQDESFDTNNQLQKKTKTGNQDESVDDKDDSPLNNTSTIDKD